MIEPKQQGYQYNDADRADQKIAVGLATTQILSPEGSKIVIKALQSQNPPKMLAAFLSRVIEMIMTNSMSTDIPMSPVVWLSEGGAIDELGEIIQAVADKTGIQIDVEQLMPAVKQELQAIGEVAKQKMAEQQSQGGPPTQDAGAPPRPQMGVMPQ